jgi:hypothetical protein
MDVNEKISEVEDRRLRRFLALSQRERAYVVGYICGAEPDLFAQAVAAAERQRRPWRLSRLTVFRAWLDQVLDRAQPQGAVSASRGA